LQVRNFGAAHFALVRPFALGTQWDVRPGAAPIVSGSDAEARQLANELIQISAKLGDFEKATAEFWALEAGTEQPPGFWAKLAQFAAEKRGKAADSCGKSRVFGGIHFWTGDRYGREMGEKVAQKVWRKAQMYFAER
jgi:hypothetical protein